MSSISEGLSAFLGLTDEQLKFLYVAAGGIASAAAVAWRSVMNGRKEEKPVAPATSTAPAQIVSGGFGMGLMDMAPAREIACQLEKLVAANLMVGNAITRISEMLLDQQKKRDMLDDIELNAARESRRRRSRVTGAGKSHHQEDEDGGEDDGR